MPSEALLFRLKFFSGFKNIWTNTKNILNYRNFIRRFLYLFGIGVVLVLLASCSDDGQEPRPQNVYDVDSEFESYVQEFIQEGAQRGEQIDFSDTGLSVAFSDFPLNGAAGLCTFTTHSIVIDKENWFRFSDRFRSYLLFHELGHCELDRLHKNDLFADGTWKSMMRGDPFQGNTIRIPVPYYGFRKSYYIDELFNPNTPSPDWSSRTFSFARTTQDTVIDQIQDVNKFTQFYSDISDNYEVEINFEFPTSESVRTRLEWGQNGENYYAYFIPLWGYIIGVTLEGLDNGLYYSGAVNQVNGQPINQITIRNQGGFDQIFINEKFIFHIDPSPLDYVKFSAMNGNQPFNSLEVNSVAIRKLEN